MTTEALNTEQSEGKPRWGEAGDKRGLTYTDMAAAFVAAFPIGKTLVTNELGISELDQWFHDNGYLNVPFGAPKNSDVWKAYLQRRHELRYKINNAGAHPRMHDRGGAFTIESVGIGSYAVRSPQQAIANNKLAAKVLSLTETKGKQLDRLMQSADWEKLPPYEQVIAASLYEDIERFTASVHNDVTFLDTKFGTLRARIDALQTKGALDNVNGGVTRFVSGE